MAVPGQAGGGQGEAGEQPGGGGQPAGPQLYTNTIVAEIVTLTTQQDCELYWIAEAEHFTKL